MIGECPACGRGPVELAPVTPGDSLLVCADEVSCFDAWAAEVARLVSEPAPVAA